MATKRMFSKTITNSARFLKMPVDSQSLYFHLCMNADDDGVVEAYSVLKITGSSEDNLKVLSAKEFIRVLNEDLVSHILDWKEHNLIRADRKVDSKYKDLLLQIVPAIELKEPKPRADTGKPTGRTMDGIGKVSIGKDSLEEVSIDINDSFNIFWDLYQKKVNPKLCKEIWKKINPELHQAIYNHVREYVKNNPEKYYRKDPERYLKYEMWTSEIINGPGKNQSFDYNKQHEENEKLFGGAKQ